MVESDSCSGRLPPAGNAFLLAQIGAHAAAHYAERVGRLDMTPAQTGVLRLIAQNPGQSQQALAAQLGVVPSKVVALIDDLETRHLIQRRRSTTDRRNYALYLTRQGQQALTRIRDVAVEHDADLTAALTDHEQRQLNTLLLKIADQQQLTPGVHPGYRTLRPTRSSAPNRSTR